MPRRRAVTARPILPLTDDLHEHMHYSGDDKDDDNHFKAAAVPTTEQSHHAIQSFRHIALPQVTISRPGSPYIKPRPVDASVTGNLSRTSSIASAGSSSRHNTFKPLLPRDRNQTSALATASTSGSSPPRKLAILPEKESASQPPLKGTSNGASHASKTAADALTEQLAQQTTYQPPVAHARPIRAVQTTRTVETVDPVLEPDVGRAHEVATKPSSSQSQLRRSPRISPRKAKVTDSQISSRTETAGGQLRRSPRKSGQQVQTQATSASRALPPEVPPAAGSSINTAESLTTVSSSRTPSINELQGESVDTSGLQTGGTVIPRERNIDVKAAIIKKAKKKEVLNCTGLPSKPKRNGKAHLDLPSHYKAGQKRSRLPAADDSEEERESEESPQREARRPGRPKSAASNGSSSVRPRRSTRKAERLSSSGPEDEPAEPTKQENEVPTTTAELLALLPKRKRHVRKVAQQDKSASEADDSLDNSVDESRQYDRENWDSSASSSDKMESDGTDYDEVEVVPTTSKVKKPPSKVQKITAPLSRSKSVKPARSKPSSSTSKTRSKTVIEISDDESRDMALKYGPGKEKRRAYFAEVDTFEMDVELVV